MVAFQASERLNSNLAQMVIIPSLHPYHLEHCVVCAGLPTDCHDEVELELRQPNPEGPVFCYVSDHPGNESGDSSACSFLHVELAIEEYFPSGPPKRKGSKKTFDKIIKRLTGTEVTANVNGTFRLDPSMISSAGFVQTEPRVLSLPGVQSAYRAASIEFRGLPVHRMEWQYCRDSDEGSVEIEISIYGIFLLSLSENYLVEALEFLRSCLSMLVTGEFDEH